MLLWMAASTLVYTAYYYWKRLEVGQAGHGAGIAGQVASPRGHFPQRDREQDVPDVPQEESSSYNDPIGQRNVPLRALTQEQRDLLRTRVPK